MAKEYGKKFGVNFTGFDKLVQKYNKLLGSGMKTVIEDCLKVPPAVINPLIVKDMKKHNRNRARGTIDSLETENPVTWNGLEATVYVGFHISRGGLPSVFLMYGTARHYPKDNGEYHSEPDNKLTEDIIGPKTQRVISDKQAKVFEKGIERLMGD